MTTVYKVNKPTCKTWSESTNFAIKMENLRISRNPPIFKSGRAGALPSKC